MQFDGGILLYVDCRKVPHAGEKRGDVGGLLGVGGGLRWREKKSASLGIDEDERRKGEVNVGAFRAFFGERVGETEFARLAKSADGTEKALWRARSANRGAEFHHGLVPVTGSAWDKQRVGSFLKLLPALPRTEIAANCADPGEDASDVAVENGEFLAVGNAENGSGRVASDAGQGQGFFQVVGEV